MARINKIKFGSKVEYIEPFDEQVGMKYLVISDLNGDWCTIQPVTGTKSSFSANIQDLKISK
jgi:hypothetical protein